MKKFVVAILMFLICFSCDNKYKDCFFENLPDNPIKNDSVSFYLDKTVEPFRHKGTKYWKMILESNKYDTLNGYWGRKGDTIIFGRTIERRFRLFPMVILNNTIGVPFSMANSRYYYDLPYKYSSEILKVDIRENDTLFYFKHVIGVSIPRVELDNKIVDEIGYLNLETKDMIEKRYYVLSLRNGIIGYSVEKGRARKIPLPYKIDY